MMKRSQKVTRAVMAAALGVTVAGVMTQADAQSKCPVEKCYGIVKKAKNDCGTPKHACAAQSKKNSDPSEWMFVMKGNCDRIVGGSLTPPGAGTASAKDKK